MWEIAPGHAAALIGGLLAGAGWLIVVRFLPGRRTAPGTVRGAALLMVVSAGVHLFLAPGHGDDPLTSLAFLVDAAALVVLAVASLGTRWWRAPAAAVLVAGVLAYVVYVLAGLERPDQVGVATKLIEVVALGLALVPVPGQRRAGQGARWVAVTAGVPALVVVTGLGAWVADLAHPGPGHQHVGAVFQPTNPIPTAEQQARADRLLADTRAAIAPYRDVRVARAAGYRPNPGPERLQHWQNPAFQKGPVLDTRRPQALV